MDLSLSTSPIYLIEHIRALEKAAVQSGITEQTLMTRAGESAFRCLQQTWPDAKRIGVVCGKGNNGGDGFIVAQKAREAGLAVEVVSLAEINAFTMLEDVDVIVDAMLGIGLSSEVQGIYRDAIDQINMQQKPVLAIDVPSGLNANTGQVHGVAIRAQKTITFIGAKLGLMTGEGVNYVGELVVDDLSLPPELFNNIRSSLNKIEHCKLPKRDRSAHKGDFGHLLIVGGDYGMPGSVRLAAQAALRMGAGLVSVATRPEHAYAMPNDQPEVMAHAIQPANDLTPLIEKANAIVIGPGLGQSEWGEPLWQTIAQTPQPKIVDADALNWLAKSPMTNSNWVLTPHPGEAARLLDTSVQTIQADRLASVKTLQNKYQGVAILKGAGTLITDAKQTSVCTAGSPGMASAGMGDVLSGIIGALLAQQYPLALAAQAGVYFHANAADKALVKHSEAALIASDVIAAL